MIKYTLSEEALIPENLRGRIAPKCAPKWAPSEHLSAPLQPSQQTRRVQPLTACTPQPYNPRADAETPKETLEFVACVIDLDSGADGP